MKSDGNWQIMDDGAGQHKAGGVHGYEYNVVVGGHGGDCLKSLCFPYTSLSLWIEPAPRISRARPHWTLVAIISGATA